MDLDSIRHHVEDETAADLGWFWGTAITVMLLGPYSEESEELGLLDHEVLFVSAWTDINNCRCQSP